MNTKNIASSASSSVAPSTFQWINVSGKAFLIPTQAPSTDVPAHKIVTGMQQALTQAKTNILPSIPGLCYLRGYHPSIWSQAYNFFRFKPYHKVLCDHHEDFLDTLPPRLRELQEWHEQETYLDVSYTNNSNSLHIYTTGTSCFSWRDILAMDLPNLPVGLPEMPDYRLWFFFLPLLAPTLWWPSLYYIILNIHLITLTTLNNPSHLALLMFGAWKLPTYSCPWFSPAANELHPIFFSWLILQGGKLWLSSVDKWIPNRIHKDSNSNEPIIQFVEIDSDATLSDSSSNGPKSPPTNRTEKALLGDINLDRALPKLLKELGAHHSQIGPLRDFLRSNKFMCNCVTELQIVVPDKVSGNRPSKHWIASRVEETLTSPEGLTKFLHLCSIEASAQLNREHFIVPIRDILVKY